MRLPNVNELSAPRAALAYVEAGIPIVPFDPKRGNGEECGNLVGGGSQPWHQLVTTDKAQLKAWRAKYGRFQALATSPGAICAVVIDLDKPDLWPVAWRKYLKDSSVPYVNTRPTQHRRRGHYWFTLPEAGQVGNRAFGWGEVRCIGGGLVLPPYRDRIVVRCGVPPTLPTELYVAFAAAGVVESVRLDEFLNRHVTETKGYKLKGIHSMFEHSLTRTGSRHHAARIALSVGFGESRLGYVSAQKVYDSIRGHWSKTQREFDELARWCASVAESADLEVLKLKSDRGPNTDSSCDAGYFRSKAK